MKRIIVCLVILLASTAVKAQEVTLPYDPNRIYTAVDQEPTFPGGMEKFYSYFMKSIHPTKTDDRQLLKTHLSITMIVEKNGSISHIKILKGISGEIDKQAIKALEKSPKWNPGMMNNQPVRVTYQLPVIIDFQSQ